MGGRSTRTVSGGMTNPFRDLRKLVEFTPRRSCRFPGRSIAFSQRSPRTPAVAGGGICPSRRRHAEWCDRRHRVVAGDRRHVADLAGSSSERSPGVAPQTSSPATQAAGTPASSGRVIIALASSGLAASPRLLSGTRPPRPGLGIVGPGPGQVGADLTRASSSSHTCESAKSEVNYGTSR